MSVLALPDPKYSDLYSNLDEYEQEVTELESSKAVCDVELIRGRERNLLLFVLSPLM